MLSEAEKKLVDDAAAKLGEHFEQVHIFVNLSRGRETGTEAYSEGIGNWWARIGQIRDFLMCEDEGQKEKTRQYVRDTAEDA
jgi:hypothetical protein